MVLDAGLRPYALTPSWGFTAIIAQQAAIYSVDLSTAPPTIQRASDLKALVYPRGMVGGPDGTLYICDSGLPPLAGYDAQKWRSESQQLSVVVHFQGDPTQPLFTAVLSGSPNAGEQCAITLGAANFALPETPGTLAQQADAWAAQLNDDPAFASLYTALATGDTLSLYTQSGTDAAGLTITATSSASLVLAGGLLFRMLTLAPAGTPATGQEWVINIGSAEYKLLETTGETPAQQAALWCTTLNAAASFSQTYTAVASGTALLIFYKAGIFASNVPFSVLPSPALGVTMATMKLAIGTMTLSGSPTTGEACTVALAGSPPYNLPEQTGLSLAQQAATWCETLNSTASFQTAYIAVAAGAVVNFFTTAPIAGTGVSLAVTSSAHLGLVATSELQNRSQFLQSIRDVVADQIPAHARWYLQSELSTL
jgi:hypothetical protein